MSTAADLLLLASNPKSGRSRIRLADRAIVLGGAMLYDLVALGRLRLEGGGLKARVTVADSSTVADPVIEAAFDRVRDRGPAKAHRMATRLGKNAKRSLDGVLTHEGSGGRRDELLQRVRGALLQDQEPDEEIGPLIGMLSAGEMVKLVVDRSDRHRAKERAAEIAKDDWISDGVRLAIARRQYFFIFTSR